MKNNLKQIEFIDNVLLPIYGFKNICDYNTIVSIKTLEQIDDFYTQINKHVGNIKKHFTSRPFSFHKSDNKIKTYQQGVSCLQKCLMIANVPYKIENIKNIKILRLSENNKTLLQYIERISTHTMTDIRSFSSGEIPEALRRDIYYRGDDFYDMITKSTETYVSKVSYKKAREGIRMPNANIKNFKIDLLMKSTDQEMYNPLAQKVINFVFTGMIENMFIRVNGCGMDSKRHAIKLGETAMEHDMYIPSKYSQCIHIVPEFDINIGDKFIDDVQVIVTYETFNIKKKLQKQIDSDRKIEIMFIEKECSKYCTQIVYDEYKYKYYYVWQGDCDKYDEPLSTYNVNNLKVAVCQNSRDCMYSFTKSNADVGELKVRCDTDNDSSTMCSKKDHDEYHVTMINGCEGRHSYEIKPIDVDMNTFNVNSIRIVGYNIITHETKEIELEYEIVDDIIKITNYTKKNPLFIDSNVHAYVVIDIPKDVPHNNVYFVVTCTEQHYKSEHRRNLINRTNMHMYDFVQFIFD
jgi:hypothetical protein